MMLMVEGFLDGFR
jgi:hypothetical protein